MKDLLIVNIIPIMLVIIAGGMIYLDKPYYGWVILGALLFMSTPAKIKKD